MRIPASGYSTLFWGSASCVASAGQVIYPQHHEVWIAVFWAAVFFTMLSGVLWLRIWWRGAGEEPAIPDMPLSAFVEGRLGANVADRDETPPEEILTGINGVFGSIRQMAALGVITVWGRQNCALGHAHVPITQIPQKYWEQGAEIDMLDYLKGGQHKLGKLTSNVFGNKSDYTDVWLNKKEIAKAFPRRLPRLKFNFPVTLEKRQ